MLVIARSLGELKFSQLMEIYIEGNLEKCEEGLSLLEAEQGFYDYLRSDFFRQKDACYFVWEDGGRYASALRLERFRDGWLLEALETAPNLRRKGFARRLMEAVLALPGYETIYSHVHKRNAPSLLLHQKCGFEIVSDVAYYVDGSVNDRAYTLAFKKPMECDDEK